MNKTPPIKLIGNIITIIVVYFLINRLLSYDIDWSMLLVPKNFIIISILITLYGLNVFVICIPWKNIIEILTSKKISFKDITLILCKSNILKYIPGNVFQYVGRNEIAVKMNISHWDAAISTVFDILLNVCAICLISLILYYPGLKIWLDIYGYSEFIFVIVAFFILTIIFGVAIIFFKKKILDYLKKFKIFINKKNLITIFLCVLYYMIMGIFTSIIYIIALSIIVGIKVPLGQANIVIGAFLISWLFGFIMIGAPAGIGIREATMTLLAGNIIPPESVLLSMVIYRIITTIGDIVALIFAKLINLNNNKV